jgi:hypothetical protein
MVINVSQMKEIFHYTLTRSGSYTSIFCLLQHFKKFLFSSKSLLWVTYDSGEHAVA